VTDPDRLAEIKQHRYLMYGPNTDPHHFVQVRLSDLDWVVGEVERLREQTNALWWARDAQRRAKEVEELKAEVERLRVVAGEATAREILGLPDN
jgi:hypothetical protein